MGSKGRVLEEEEVERVNYEMFKRDRKMYFKQESYHALSFSFYETIFEKTLKENNIKLYIFYILYI